MTLFDQCVEAAEAAQARHYDRPDYAAITRAVLETVRDCTPSPRTVDEMCRVLGGAREWLANSNLPPISNTASDRMLERLPVRIGPNCEPVVRGERW